MLGPLYSPMDTTPSSSLASTSNYPPVESPFASTSSTSSGPLYHDPLWPIGNPSLSGGPSFPISTLRSSFPNMARHSAAQRPLTNPHLPSEPFLSPTPYFPLPLPDRHLNPAPVPSGSAYPSSSTFVPETAYDAAEHCYSPMPPYGPHDVINFDTSFQGSLQHPPSLSPLPLRSEQQSPTERSNENPSSVHWTLIDIHASLGEDHKPHDQESNITGDPAKVRKVHRDRRPISPRISEGSHIENPHTRYTADFLAPVLQRKVRPSPADQCVCLLHAHPRKFPSFARHIRGHVMYAARSWLAGSSPYSDVLWLHATAIILKRDEAAIDDHTQNEIDQFLATYREYSVSATVERGNFPMFSLRADEEASRWVVQWQCRICEVDLGRPDSLTRHMKHIHKIG
jgi:hypothetical protein